MLILKIIVAGFVLILAAIGLLAWMLISSTRDKCPITACRGTLRDRGVQTRYGKPAQVYQCNQPNCGEEVIFATTDHDLPAA